MNLKSVGLSLRSICTPGFHCHGCPWATAACPIGIFAFSSSLRQIPAFALAWILVFGLAVGRLVCSFGCPFGLLQEVLHRIPSKKLRLPEWTRFVKYAALALLVFILPWMLGFEEVGYLKLKATVNKGENDTVTVKVVAENLGQKSVESPTLNCAFISKDGAKALIAKQFLLKDVVVAPGDEKQVLETSLPNMIAEADLAVSSPQSVPASIPRYGLYFCRICPDGALTASLPAKLSSGAAAAGQSAWTMGGVLDVKFFILVVFLILMVVVSRPFCRILCPLGALYGLTSVFAVFRVVKTGSPCSSCGVCDKVCPVDLDVRRQVGGMECIACGECVKACPGKCFVRGVGIKPARSAVSSER